MNRKIRVTGIGSSGRKLSRHGKTAACRSENSVSLKGCKSQLSTTGEKSLLKVKEQILKNLSAFINVALPESEHAFFELELSSGSTLRIPSGTDNKTLSSVLSVLREVGLC
jgi:hypothetical protein